MDCRNQDENILIAATALPGTPELDRVPELALGTWEGGAPRLATGVRVAAQGGLLHVLFRCAYDRLHVDPGLPRDRSVPRLWELDVVELFVAAADDSSYHEVEATPLGQWLALAFAAPRVAAPGTTPLRPLVAAAVGDGEFRVTLSLPLEALGGGPAPRRLRLGLFRVHGREPNREYQALRPTGTAVPDFHRPERWPEWVLSSSRGSRSLRSR